MRGINIIIPNEKREIVLRTLKKLGMKFSMIHDDVNTFIVLTISEELAEVVIDALKKVGVGSLYGNLMIYTIEYALPESIKKEVAKSVRISREEILVDVRKLAQLNRNYVLGTILASLLATLGLITDNLIMIIASMIIAPVIGPILGVSLGTVLGLQSLRKTSLISEIVGLALSVLSGFFTALLMPHSTVTSQIMLRAYPTLVDVLFAIIAGLAAALSITSATAVMLVGVAIAASVVPPAANIGIGIAFLFKNNPCSWQIIMGSSLLLLVNIVAINLMTIIFFWLTGLKPGLSARKELLARRLVRRQLLAIILAALVILAPISISTVSYYKKLGLEESIRKDLSKYLLNRHPELEIIEIKVNYDLGSNTAVIWVKIAAHDVSTVSSDLPKEIREYVENKYEIRVVVYVEILLRS